MHFTQVTSEVRRLGELRNNEQLELSRDQRSPGFVCPGFSQLPDWHNKMRQVGTQEHREQFPSVSQSFPQSQQSQCSPLFIVNCAIQRQIDTDTLLLSNICGFWTKIFLILCSYQNGVKLYFIAKRWIIFFVIHSLYQALPSLNVKTLLHNKNKKKDKYPSK